jgi:hypothetical protein
MSGPTGKEGQKQQAKLWVAHVALPAMEKALAVLGSQSEEGQAILGALKTLSKAFSSAKSNDLGLNTMVSLMGRRGK